MFHTVAEPAELQALTAYSEKHGDERVSGLALKLSITQPNTILDLFDPQLRAAFYRANDTISAQTDEPQAETPTPVLKFAALAGIRWTKQITGAVVEIRSDDLLGETKVRVTEATVDNFAFNLLEGGSVETSLRVKCKPEPEHVGSLYERLRQTVLVTITPPEHATYEPAAAEGAQQQDDDDRQGDLVGDGDGERGDDADDNDGPRTSDDMPASAVAADPDAETASSVPVTHRRRRRAAREVLDGTRGNGFGTVQ